MSQFSLIYLFVFIVNLSILIYLLLLKNRSLQIKAFMVLLTAYLVTLFCFVIFLSSHNINTMKFWLNISHYTGPIANIALLYLIATFYNNGKNPPLWINVLILISVSPLIVRNMFGFLDTVTFIPNSIGNIVEYRASVLSYYFYIHTFILIIFIMIFFIVKYRTTEIRRLRKLSIFFMVTTGVSWTLCVPGNFIIPYLFKKHGVLVPATGVSFLFCSYDCAVLRRV